MAYGLISQFLFRAMDVEQGGDSDQKPPPRPISHHHEFADVSLKTSDREVLELPLRQLLPGQVSSTVGLEVDDHACEPFIALRFQLGQNATPEENLKANGPIERIVLIVAPCKIKFFLHK